MTRELRALIIEDCEDDMRLLVRQLQRGGYAVTHQRVDTAAGLTAALSEQTWDVIFADYAMPHFNAVEALDLWKQTGRDLPFIIVSGTIGEEVAVAAMKAGAHDYLMKGNLARLVPAVERELREARVRAERREAEQRIRASLLEKEVLLKEIHHRVKNNLQVISSLLNLQAEHIKNEQDAERFRQARFRIKSMALIHDKLYHSGNLASIDFADYIRTLSAELFRAFAVHPERIAMKTELEGNLEFGIDVAIPCGLILNELVSNALRHAFPAGRSGSLRIGLQRTVTGACMLSVADDGCGLPDRFAMSESSSFGLPLVKTLTEQLGGNLEIVSGSGTEFRVSFPAPAPRDLERHP